MNEFRFFKTCLLAALVGLGICLRVDQAGEQPVPSAPSDAVEGIEVLTRGPVHEAFAETVTFNPEPGIVAPKAPPEAIEEIPPDQRPEGDHVTWVPGYWAWDDERDDFLWVSGIWRALPPDRQWLPGYWAESRRGFQWTSGYWADSSVTEIEYLPAPPASVEVGPNIAAPSANYSWLPGSWVWHQTRYAWRPGYWAPVQADWVWTPAYYVWSPRGYVFVDGYWDYSVARRGVLFAPVYFSRNVYARRGFNYSPATVINPVVLISHLFLRPNYQHYYFGDYYATNYSNAGFYPWFSYNSSRYGYDPIYAQQRWQNRQNLGWEQNLQAAFNNRRDHEHARPPRTLTDQRTLVASGIAPNEMTSLVVASPFDQLAKSKENPIRFQSVDKEERQELAKHRQDIQKYRQERQKLEAKVADTSSEKATSKKPAGKFQPTKVKLSRSPLVAQTGRQLGKDQTPPKRHEVLKPDLQVDPNATPKDQPKTGTKGDRKANPKDEPQSVPKADRKSIPKDEPTSEPKADRKSIPKDEPTSDPKADRKSIPKDEPTSDPKADRKSNPKDEPQSVPKADRKPDTKVDPKPVNKVDPKPTSKDVPRADSKVDPRNPKAGVNSSKGERSATNRSESRPAKVNGSQPLDPKRPSPSGTVGDKTPRAGKDPFNPAVPPRDEQSQTKPRRPSQPKVAPPAQQPQNKPAAGPPAPAPKSENSKDKSKGK